MQYLYKLDININDEVVDTIYIQSNLLANAFERVMEFHKLRAESVGISNKNNVLIYNKENFFYELITEIEEDERLEIVKPIESVVAINF